MPLLKISGNVQSSFEASSPIAHFGTVNVPPKLKKFILENASKDFDQVKPPKLTAEVSQLLDEMIDSADSITSRAGCENVIDTLKTRVLGTLSCHRNANVYPHSDPEVTWDCLSKSKKSIPGRYTLFVITDRSPGKRYTALQVNDEFVNLAPNHFVVFDHTKLHSVISSHLWTGFSIYLRSSLDR